MITLRDIQKEYIRIIPKKKRVNLEKHISTNETQFYIKKALNYTLTNKDIDTIYEMDKNGFPSLYWLCQIYIHPLTIGASILNKLSKF